MAAIAVSLSRIEPVRIEEKVKVELAEASLALAKASDRLSTGLPPETLVQVAAMIRVINSYYSNRIEGNNTLPRDIETALAGTLDMDPRRGAMQREAAADVQLQAEIDHRAAWGQLEDPTHPDFIRWLHRQLYRDVDTTVPIIRRTNAGEEEIVTQPGIWRDGDVEVRDHLSLPHDQVPAYMDHFHARLCQDELHGQTAKILAMATADHRGPPVELHPSLSPRERPGQPTDEPFNGPSCRHRLQTASGRSPEALRADLKGGCRGAKSTAR